MKKFIIISFIIVCLFSLAGCQKTEDLDQIGIDFDIILSEPLYENSYIDITYEWLINEPVIEYDADTRVFVHFWNLDQKSMLLQDDHDFPFSSQEFTEKNSKKYVRRLMVPPFIKYLDRENRGIERIRVNAGLYNPEKEGFNKLLFTGNYSFSTLPYKYPRIIFHEGWHNEEAVPQEKDRTFRWTSDRAVLIVDNTGIDMDFHLKGTVYKHFFPEQSISVFVNDELIDEFIPEESDFYRIMRIPQKLIEGKRAYFISFETDQTFIPSEMGLSDSDSRQLGIMVSLVFFQGASPAYKADTTRD